MSGIRPVLKNVLLRTVSTVTRRHVVLLPREARPSSLLSVSAPYGVGRSPLEIGLLASERGELSVQVYGYNGHAPTRAWGPRFRTPYRGPDTLRLTIPSGDVTFGGTTLGRIDTDIPTRRFCCALMLETDAGRRYSRLTSHFVQNMAAGDGRYFAGDNYVDYEQESAGDHLAMANLFERFAAVGPVLDVGCATGGLIDLLGRRGVEAYGVDTSTWAIERARQRAGADRAWVWNPERDAVPPAIEAAAPFRTLSLASVLEHFHDPFAILERLTRLAASDARLFVTTTNADSLTRHVFGAGWEGHFDPTHFGVDQVSVRTLRERLPAYGWRVLYLRTHLAWDRSADPTHATVRDWYTADGRFRELLIERDLGDLVTCVAART